MITFSPSTCVMMSFQQIAQQGNVRIDSVAKNKFTNKTYPWHYLTAMIIG